MGSTPPRSFSTRTLTPCNASQSACARLWRAFVACTRIGVPGCLRPLKRVPAFSLWAVWRWRSIRTCSCATGRGVSLVNEATGERVGVPEGASHVFFVRDNFVILPPAGW